MSSALVVAWWCLIAASPEVELPRALVTDVEAVAPLAEAARALSDAIGVAVTNTGVFRVLTTRDIKELLGAERQRELLGCTTEGTSCLTEVTDALGGAAVLVSSSLTKLGDVYQLSVQGLDSRRGRVIGRSTRMARDLSSLRATLPFMVAEATGTPAPPEPSRLGPGLLIGAGAAAAVAGGVLFLQAAFTERTTSAELRLAKEQSGVSLKSLDWYAEQARLVEELRVIGGISAGVGVALAVTGIVLWPKSLSAGVASRLVVTPNGFALAGVWP